MPAPSTLLQLHDTAWHQVYGTAPVAERGFVFDFRLTSIGPLIITRPKSEPSPFRADSTYTVITRLAPIDRSTGREVNIRAPEYRKWMTDLFAVHGMLLTDVPHLTVEDVPFGRPGKPYVRTIVVSCRVRIADKDRADKAWANGIGRYRAYGCGTLMLKKSH